MNAAFIIAEYNPFHNGHAYHIAKTREILQPDALICIMSGHFTQRGSAAIVDKWSRARMALHGGADLVLELHPVYACSSAETFARGALMTISLLGVGGWLSFGAEDANLQVLSELAKISKDESDLYKTLLNEAMSNGQSFAAARQIALVECYMILADKRHDYSVTNNELNIILRGSNNILAIEYIKAIQCLGLPIIPFPLLRAGSVSYGSDVSDVSDVSDASDASDASGRVDGAGVAGTAGSARAVGAVRAAGAVRAVRAAGAVGGSIGSLRIENAGWFEEATLKKTSGHDACPVYRSASFIRDEYHREYCKYANINTPQSFERTVLCNDYLLIEAIPEYSRALLNTEIAMGRGPVFDETCFSFISTLIRREGAAALRRFIDVNEGLENRICDAAMRAASYAKLIDMSATRRYPKSRIRRILTRFMLGYDEAVLKTLHADEAPPYIRVLGFNDAGQKLLAHCKPEVPMITNFKTLKHSSSRSRGFMRLDAKATDIYAMNFQNSFYHTAGQDFLRGPARI